MDTTLLLTFGLVLVVSGVFSMFGKGGGSLYTPVLVMLGFAIGTAISTALFLSLVTALVATLVFARNRLVDWRFSFTFLPGTVAGSLLGAQLSARAPRDLLMGIFAVFLVVAGFLMFTSSRHEGRETRPGPLSRGRLAVVVAFSFGVGVLSSLIGIGGGLVIFPFLIVFMRYPARQAAGANAFIVAVSATVGTLGHWSVGHADFRLLGVTAVAAAIGSAVGSHVTVKASPRFVTVAFAFVLWFFAAQIALDLAGVL